LAVLKINLANSAMEEMFKFIENSNDCQFTLDTPKDELKIVCKNPELDNKTIKVRLKLKYGTY